MDVVVVGAGFAGMYMVHKAREAGLSVHAFEAGSGVGGTWYWNRYPGARCDVESLQYSYEFSEELQQEWNWTERYAGQPEILSYANHVADRFDLRTDITFNTRITTAHFDEDAQVWRVATDGGHDIEARYLVLATGCLSSANTPKIPGLESFAGPTYHTGKWPHEGVDFAGKRVGVIGTGSSGIQAIPHIAAEAGHLTVFQRTANYSVPARNGALDPDEVAKVKANYPEIRATNAMEGSAFKTALPRGEGSVLEVDDAERHADFERRWEHGGFVFLQGFIDTMLSEEANRYAADFARSKIREVVSDPATAEILSPKQLIGCKRLCLDTEYFETYNRPNVDLVDIAANPIAEITPQGVQTDEFYELDVLVLATGFDAMTGSITRIDIRGRDGQTIADAWSAGPKNYLGLGVEGFPNMFTITGPGSPSVLTNMLVSIQQHVDWIARCITDLDADGVTTIEPTNEAQTEWVTHVNSIADVTLYPSCNSWYLGANVPGKTRVFMPLIGYPDYVERCDAVAADGYAGFALTS